MEPRLALAYAIIALLVLAGLAWAVHARRNTRDRKFDREKRREDDANAIRRRTRLEADDERHHRL